MRHEKIGVTLRSVGNYSIVVLIQLFASRFLAMLGLDQHLCSRNYVRVDCVRVEQKRRDGMDVKDPNLSVMHVHVIDMDMET